MYYRKKGLLTEATQWFKNGDHPQDESEPIEGSGDPPKLSEGKIVQSFHSLELDVPENQFCPDCGNIMLKHGVLEGVNGREFICPGDYIVTDRNGMYYRLSKGEFESQYERYAPPPRNTPTKQPISDIEERLQRRRSMKQDNEIS